jgi:hypothetical protein
MDDVIRKYNSTLSSFLQNACPKQNMNIAVNRAEVAFAPATQSQFYELSGPEQRVNGTVSVFPVPITSTHLRSHQVGRTR